MATLAQQLRRTQRPKLEDSEEAMRIVDMRVEGQITPEEMSRRLLELVRLEMMPPKGNA